MIIPNRTKIQKQLLCRVLPFAVGMLFLTGCDLPFFTPPTATPTNTATPTSTNTPTFTLTPTDTPTPTVDKTGTKEAQKAETAAAKTQAAESAMADIEAALTGVGEEMGSGSVLYVEPEPIAVEATGVNGWNEESLPKSVDAKDFAFHSKMTWEVKQKIGLVYCILMYRISGSVNEDPFYMMSIGRISGLAHIWFDLYDKGRWVVGSNPLISNAIDTANQAQNDVLLVVRANRFTAYVNGKKVGSWANSKSTHGTFRYATNQDTGTSICTWADTWIWGFE